VPGGRLKQTQIRGDPTQGILRPGAAGILPERLAQQHFSQWPMACLDQGVDVNGFRHCDELLFSRSLAMSLSWFET
jgi:hypothetical protein